MNKTSIIRKGLQAKLRSMLRRKISQRVPIPRELQFRVEDETIRFRVTPMKGREMVSDFWNQYPDPLPGRVVMGYWLVGKREFINWVFSGQEEKWIKLWTVEEWL